MPDLSPTPDARRRLHAIFRPRRARRVAYPVAAIMLVLLVVIAVAVPGEYQWYDRLGIALVGVAIAWFLHRQGSVSATPTERGLVVRNLLLSRSLEWAQVVDVRFGGGRPWVQLDISDGDTLAVMAIQRADGDRALTESRRLATLVALHSPTDQDD